MTHRSKFNCQPKPDVLGLELSDSSSDQENESNSGEESNEAGIEENINQLDADLLRNQKNAGKSFKQNHASSLNNGK